MSLSLLLAASTARGDHAGMDMGPAAASPTWSAGTTLVAASFGTPFYVGAYDGVVPSITVHAGRWSGAAAWGLYRIDANGRTLYGAGDLALSASTSALSAGPWRAGATVMLGAPTGDQPTGFGMGHAMAMPAVWGERDLGALHLRATLGYARALTGLGGHDHGAWPLVDPMNLQEITWGAASALPVSRSIAARAFAGGAWPVGVSAGVTRIAGGAGVIWAPGRTALATEVQAGLWGEPFTVRGVVSAAVTF